MTERLRLRRDAELEVAGTATLVEGHMRMGLGTLSPGVRAALDLLASEGADEDALGDAALAAEGESALMGVQLLLRRLEQTGWIERLLFDEERLLATVTPIGHELVPVLKATGSDTPLVLSRFALVRADEGRLVVETPKASLQVTLHAPAAAGAIFALAAPATPADVGLELLPLLRLLVRAGIAVSPGAEDGRALAQWAFADLLFHARSRVGRHLGGYGGSFKLEGRFESLPGVREQFSPSIALTAPDLDELARTDPTFTQVLESRSSIRVHDDEHPLDVAQLGEFLYRAARIKGVWNDGHEDVVSRPYPAGGSLHELELYPLVNLVEGLEPGLYHYDGQGHTLGLVAAPGPPTKLLLEYARRTGVMETPPQVTILVAARFGRMMWKYESMAYAAVLKHVGVLYQTMYLVATAMGLAPCGLGGGNSDAFAAAAGTDYYEESSVGEFLLGSSLGV